MKKLASSRWLRAAAAVLLAVGAGSLAAAPGAEKKPAGNGDMVTDQPSAAMAAAAAATETAVLAGGCFWGVEAVFERLEGVLDVTSGYAGGEQRTARYELVGTGRTGHAESVRIVFDPIRVSYGTLLRVFFTVAHDPTQLNFQGPDFGPQYRSAIFYASEEQRRIAEESVRTLDKARVYSAPIVTVMAPLVAFYPAEGYHQDFMKRNPTHPYIQHWDLPKIAQLEQQFPELLARP